jgi:hypothetical protein
MVVGGYDAAFRRLASLLDVRTGCPVAAVTVTERVEGVGVTTAAGETLWGAAAIVTVPLGVLKAGTIAFSPPLPDWKAGAVARLGFGDLNKVVLQFPEPFWDDSVDFFGAAAGAGAADRGWCFMFWNFHRFAGAPVLAALVSGAAARAAEGMDDSELRDRAVATLRALHPGVAVPDPVACTVSRWGGHPYARGSYSYVAVGSSSRDYDQLAQPVQRRVLFAGEHTVKAHPDTVGGAMLSGLREAARALEILGVDAEEGRGGGAAATAAAAAAALKRRAAVAERDAQRAAKRPRSGGAEDEGDGEDDDLERRMDRAMGWDVARLMEGQRAREAARHDTKAVWRALAAAAGGDAAPLRDLLAACDDVAARHTVARCMAQAEVRALEAAAGDAGCLVALRRWLDDAAGAPAEASLADQLLRALRALPLAAAVARDSGLAALVRQRGCTHGDPGVRKQAQALARGWAAAEGAAAAGAAAAPAAAAAAAPAAAAALDEEMQRAFEAEAAEISRLQESAAAAAAEAASWEAQAAEGGAPAPLASFDAFRQERRDGKKKPKPKAERAAGQGAGEPRRPGPPSDGRPPSANGGGGAAGDGDDTRRHVDLLICSFLRPQFDARRVTKEQYKAILARASDKVMGSGGGGARGGKRFAQDQRLKIQRLVEGYVESYARKGSGGGGAGGGGR